MTTEALTAAEDRTGGGRRDPFPGSSRMAELMRRTDWARTPIGSPDLWPESLRTAVGVCLESRFPIVLWWGPELILLYNDAYLPALGDKHPESLGQRGQDCWREIWPTIGPMLDGVMQRAEATWSDDLLLYLRRRGFAEECYFTFSYSPIRTDDGRVGGVFCAVNETTGRVRSERRLALLRELSATGPVDPGDAARRAVETIGGASMDVTFSALYLRADGDGLAEPILGSKSIDDARRAALDAGVRDAAASRRPDWLVLGGPVSTEHDQGGPAGDVPDTDAARTGEPALEVRVIPMPDSSGGTPDVLVLGRNPAILRDDVYEAFFGLVATHVATVLAAARAHEAERRRADVLAELDRAKTVFFMNVSHEFRTPLTLLDAPLRELADDPSLGPEHAERIEIGRRAAGRLRRLVNTLLEFSRIEAGTSRPQLEPVDAYDAAADVASVFRSAYERAGLTLAVKGERLARSVLADPEMLERILLNLVSNALKFTATGGVEIEVGAVADEAIIGVRDTGIGIAEADLERIFDRFGRVETSWSRSREGSGIGLALASELARLQGGRLEVTSRLGLGTTFRLVLPLADARPRRPSVRSQDRAAFADEASAWVHVGALPGTDVTAQGAHRAMRASAAEAAPHDTRPGVARVLVVDDNADMSAYLAKILRRHWTVETAFDGLSGLEMVLRDPPDLVLADVMMPGIDGLELVRRIRAEDRLATLPVVLLSARAGEEARSEGLAAGADEYLVKPFTATDLVVRISTRLERERVRRAEAGALRASENRWRTLIEENPNPIATCDATGSVTYLNPAWLAFLGVGRPGPVGWAWTEFVHPEDRSRIAHAWRQALRIGEGHHVEARVRHADAEFRWLSLAAAPVRDEAGTIGSWIWVANDIHVERRSTDDLRALIGRLQENERDLNVALRVKDEFLGMISHELRTPVTTIRGNAELLVAKAGRLDSARQQEALQDIAAEADRLNRVIENLLLLAKAGSDRLEQEPLLLRRLIDSIVADVTRHTPSRRIVLRCRDDLMVDANHGAVEQILKNLLSNALKYSAPDEPVAIRCVRERGWIRVSVHDRGVGLDEVDREQVFEPFYRAERTRHVSGVGIGLTVARRLADAVGGTLHAESSKRGSTFVLTLPELLDDASAEEAEPATPIDVPAGSAGEAGRGAEEGLRPSALE